jgi:hypothetical protein
MANPQITDITDVTDGAIVSTEWEGSGIFDVLMAAVNKNIEVQYLKGRLKGADYATVYLGSIQAVLAESTQYVHTERQLVLDEEKVRLSKLPSMLK